MSWFKNLFRREPEHNTAIYIDIGKDGKHYARLVTADHPKILNGCPKTEFMRPVAKGFDNALSAAYDARFGLRRLGWDEGIVKALTMYAEQEDGEVKRL